MLLFLFFLPGMSPRCQCVVTLHMSHLTGCSLLYVHGHVHWLSFGPVGTLLQIPILMAIPGEKQWSLLPLLSPSETATLPMVWWEQELAG